MRDLGGAQKGRGLKGEGLGEGVQASGANWWWAEVCI